MVALRITLGATALLSVGVGVLAQPGQPQKPPPPSWLDDEGKDIFSDLESDENPYSANACELREKLLKKMAGKSERDASERRVHVLVGLGLCTLKKGDYNIAKKRLESAISEMNVPSEDWMLQNQQVAHIALVKQGTAFLSKFETTQAATAFRRGREILDRNLKKIVKMVHKQMPAGQAPPLENIIEELPGLGKTGNILPMIVKQVPVLQSELAFADVLDQALADLDKRIAGVDTSLKSKKLRLDTSKGKAKGSLMYVPALLSEAVVPADRSGAVQELISNGAVDAFMKEAASMEKGATLVKRSKEGTGCKQGKGLEKTCEAVMKVADIASNGFGETRVVFVKAGKQQQLDVCETNSNIAILVAAKDGASVKIKDVAEKVVLAAGEPVVVDFCREVVLEATSGVPVLFSQAWHPEFAALERSTELRGRAKPFGLSEDEVKAATKVVNDAAKKGWEKTATLWRKESEGHGALKASLEGEEQDKIKKAEDAAEAKRLEEEAGDEDRKERLEKLEQKRAEKRKKEEAAEAARVKRKKQLEEERANRDPWLNFPSVLEAEKTLEEMKEARRDANAKLEFELSTQLTKDISAQERLITKTIKQAKKFHKKGGTAADDAAKMKGETADKSGEAPAAEEKKESKETKKETKQDGKKEAKDKDAKKPTKESKELKELRGKLEDVIKQKQEAADKEDFKGAKKLKQEQEKLEKNIKKLEL